MVHFVNWMKCYVRHESVVRVRCEVCRTEGVQVFYIQTIYAAARLYYTMAKLSFTIMSDRDYSDTWTYLNTRSNYIKNTEEKDANYYSIPIPPSLQRIPISRD